MISSSRIRAKISVAAAMVAAVALAGVTSEPAQAGCGRKVSSETSRSAHGSSSNLREFALAGAFVGSPGPMLPDRKLPCAGASCSEGDRLPQVPALASSTASELWCSLPAALVHTRPDSRDIRTGQYTVRALACTSPIERPPRLPDLS